MNLLAITDTAVVKKTTLTRKLTLGGVTKTYPVYSVRLDVLFYNDQNDRIATWITQYKNETGDISFSADRREEYNKIIERFIIGSNPAAIEKTKNNIALVNQREPGIVLSDGRIIDGNRRYTCLRLLSAERADEHMFFETVILDDTVQNNQKQIKMLELAIQHGEEQRVDYSQIDMAIGAYHDIIETQLLTIDEYAQSTNETIPEVRKRLEVAQLIIDFLSFMNVPKQYHIAREMHVYDALYELLPILKKCDSERMRQDVTTSVFNNLMMGSFSDQRKYIRNLKGMMDTGFFASYINKQNRINEELAEKKAAADIRTKKDLDAFVKENEDTTEDLQISMDRSLLQTKKAQTKSKPSQIVSKSLSMLMDIDTRIFDKLSEDEKDKLHTQLHRLTDAVSLIDEEVMPAPSVADSAPKQEVPKGRVYLAARHINEPVVFCERENFVITNLTFSLPFSAYRYSESQAQRTTFLAQFISEGYEEISPLQEFEVCVGETSKVNFSLNASASSLKDCYLLLKSSQDSQHEAQQITKYKINISFNVDFDF